jgi:hypothetical protein
MKVKKLEDGWWIVDVPDDVLEMGPYATKAEALDDMKGVQRTLDSLRPSPKQKRIRSKTSE